MMPLILIIVGVHFLPLAWLLRMPIHYLTGTLLVGVAVVTLVAVPARSTVAGSHHIASWWVVCGGATSVVLWFVGGWLIVLSARLVRHAPHTPAQRVCGLTAVGEVVILIQGCGRLPTPSQPPM